jgi:hypothetical protein
MVRNIKLLGIAVFYICVLCTSTFSAVSIPSDVQGYSGTEVHFKWGKSSGVVSGYRIYWGETKGGPYPNRLCDVIGTEQQYITKLNKTQTYYLICRAYNIIGESGNSNEVVWPTI